MTVYFDVFLDQEGKAVTAVLDGQGHLCTEVYKVTNAVGTEVSDEETGPDCDTVHETNL